MKVFIPHYSNEVEKRVLKEKATMPEPRCYNIPGDGMCEECNKYQEHLFGLQTIPFPDMTPEFGKREEVIAGRDFELQWEIYDSGIGRWLKETALTQDPFNNAQRREVAIAIEGKPDREEVKQPMSKKVKDKFLQSKISELGKYYKWGPLETRSVEFLVIQTEQIYASKVVELEKQLTEALKILTINKSL